MPKKIETKNKKYYSAESVSYALNMSGLLNEQAADALRYLPKEVVDFVAEKCALLEVGGDWNGDGDSASHWNLNDDIFKEKERLIIFDARIWREDPLRYTVIVTHEVAHAFLGHEIKTDGRDLKQEKAADMWTVKCLSIHWPKEEILKYCNYLNGVVQDR